MKTPIRKITLIATFYFSCCSLVFAVPTPQPTVKTVVDCPTKIKTEVAEMVKGCTDAPKWADCLERAIYEKYDEDVDVERLRKMGYQLSDAGTRAGLEVARIECELRS